jgi:cytochrome c biogenesis protein CcdA
MEAGLQARPHAAARGWLAVSVVVAALLIAVGGALLTAGGIGPIAGVERIAGGAQQLLEQVGLRLPFGYAFAAGMVAAVNPCGFSLLPAYVALYLGDRDHPLPALPPRGGGVFVSRALAVSGAVTVSFLLLFGVTGVVLSAATAALVGWFPWASLAVGVLLVLTGGRMLAGASFYVALPERLGDRLQPAARTGVLRYFAYGLAFALCSLSCTLPIFLTVVGSGFTVRGFVPALAGFLLYGLGMAFVLAVLTIAAATFRSLFGPVRRASAWVEPASAILLVLTGSYVVYYWLTLGGLLGR